MTTRPTPYLLLGALILLIAIALNDCYLSAPRLPAEPTLTPVVIVVRESPTALVTATATPTVVREPLVEITATTREPAATMTPTPVPPTETPRPPTRTVTIQNG